jgi:hypothetical protein
MTNFPDRDVETKLLWPYLDEEESFGGIKHCTTETVTTLAEALPFLIFSGGGDSGN